jgi:hypothetical protein
VSSSAFEQAMQEIARRKHDNGGVTTDDLLVAIIAANDDRREATADTDKRLLNLTERFELHIADKPIVSATEAVLEYTHEDERDRKALAVELAAYKQQVKAAVDAVAVELTAYRIDKGREPRRCGDPPDKDYRAETEVEGDMQRAWRVGKWAVMVLCVALVSFGLSYWADSCSRAQYWGPGAPITATPTPTATK